MPQILQDLITMPRMDIAELSDADIKQVVLAPSRAAAQHMSRARMLFTCGDYTHKRGNMSQVFEWLSHAAAPGQDNLLLKILSRFSSIQEGLPAEDAQRYQVKASFELRKQEQWRYELTIGKTTVRAERHLPYGDGLTFAHFQDCLVLQGVRQALRHKNSNLEAFFSSFRDTRLAWLELNRQHAKIPAPETDVAEKFCKLAIEMMYLQVRTRDTNQGRPFKPGIVVHARERYELKIGVRTVHRGKFPSMQEDRLKQFVHVVAAAVEAELAYQLHLGAVPYNDRGKHDPGRLDQLAYGTDPSLDVLMCDAAAKMLPAVAAHKKLMSAQEIELFDQRIDKIVFGGANLDKLWEDQPRHPPLEPQIEMRTEGNWLARPDLPRAPRPALPHPYVTAPWAPRIGLRMMLIPRPPMHGVPPGSFMPWRVPVINHRPLGNSRAAPLISRIDVPSNAFHAAPSPVAAVPGPPPGIEARSRPGNGIGHVARYDPGFPHSLA